MTSSEEGGLRVVGRLLVSGAVLLMALCLTGAALLRVPAPANDFVQSIKDKLRRLSATSGRRIILLGGSSNAFGYDSPAISAAIGRPVINMGVSAGFGLNFILRSVEDSIRGGDVVIVSPEYELFYPFKGSNIALYEILTYLPNPDTYLNSLAESVEYRLQKPVQRLQRITMYWVMHPFTRRAPEAVYRRDLFNAEGDLVLPRDMRSAIDVAHFDARPRPPRLPDPVAIRRLRSFSESMTRRGASVVLVYPPLLSLRFTADSANIRALDEALHRSLGDVLTIVGRPEDFVRRPEEFLNTEYHLTPAGREHRTAQVIALLKPLLTAVR